MDFFLNDKFQKSFFYVNMIAMVVSKWSDCLLDAMK